MKDSSIIHRLSRQLNVQELLLARISKLHVELVCMALLGLIEDINHFVIIAMTFGKILSIIN